MAINSLNIKYKEVNNEEYQIVDLDLDDIENLDDELFRWDKEGSILEIGAEKNVLSELVLSKANTKRLSVKLVNVREFVNEVHSYEKIVVKGSTEVIGIHNKPPSKLVVQYLDIEKDSSFRFIQLNNNQIVVTLGENSELTQIGQQKQIPNFSINGQSPENSKVCLHAGVLDQVKNVSVESTNYTPVTSQIDNHRNECLRLTGTAINSKFWSKENSSKVLGSIFVEDGEIRNSEFGSINMYLEKSNLLVSKGEINRLKMVDSKVFNQESKSDILEVNFVEKGSTGELSRIYINLRGKFKIRNCEDLDSFTPVPQTWSDRNKIFSGVLNTADPMIFFPKRVCYAVMCLFKSAKNEKFEYNLLGLTKLVSDRSNDTKSVIGTRYAWLCYRQTHANDWSERSLLLAGRCLGFGLRLLRPLIIWVVMACISLVIIKLLNDEPIKISFRTPLSILEAMLEPIEIIRGVSNESFFDNREFGEWEILKPILRILIAIPFATFILALSKRLRWDR